jgi:hypothetical protein
MQPKEWKKDDCEEEQPGSAEEELEHDVLGEGGCMLGGYIVQVVGSE